MNNFPLLCLKQLYIHIRSCKIQIGDQWPKNLKSERLFFIFSSKLSNTTEMIVQTLLMIVQSCISQSHVGLTASATTFVVVDVQPRPWPQPCIKLAANWCRARRKPVSSDVITHVRSRTCCTRTCYSNAIGINSRVINVDGSNFR